MVAIGTALTAFGAAIAAAIGNSMLFSTAIKGIVRQPEVASTIQTVMFIGMAAVESIPITAIVIAFILSGNV